jgi:hypothetical protein
MVGKTKNVQNLVLDVFYVHFGALILQYIDVECLLRKEGFILYQLSIRLF